MTSKNLKNPENRKSDQVVVRCTPSERETLARIAKLAQTSEGDVMRRLLAIVSDGGDDEAVRRLESKTWGDLPNDQALIAKYLGAPLEQYVRDAVARVARNLAKG